MAKRKDVVIKEDDKEIVIPKYKQKTMLDHFMILLGVITAVLIFLVVFDILYEVSFFGWLFSRDEWNKAAALMTGNFSANGDIWNTMLPPGENGTFPPLDPSNPIYDDSLDLKGFWMPTVLYTIFFIVSVVGVVWLITYYVRDYVEVFRGLIRGIVEIKKGVTGSVKDAFSDFEKVEIKTKKSHIIEGSDSSFIAQVDKKPKKKKVEDKEEKVNQPIEGREVKRGRGRPPKKQDDAPKAEKPVKEKEEVDSYSSDELDYLLTSHPQEGEKEEVHSAYTTKSLFSGDDED